MGQIGASRAGIPVLQGLRTIADTVSSPSARKEVLDVAEGISAGDNVIVVGQQTVANGDRIRIVGEN